MKIQLKIWRQKNPATQGSFVDYNVDHVSPEMSFLEMLDVLNQDLIKKGQEPVAFDHDCREGICGSCGLVINGDAHGPEKKTATCQLHMRKFKDGDTIIVEPWRARAFPTIKDLVVVREAFDQIIAAGGFVSVNTGNAPDANVILVPKKDADQAFDAAACIGCGACVAACKNASAMLFVAAKVSHLALLPQGKSERHERVKKMIQAMDEAGFGNCSNTGACENACPQGVKLSFIARMNAEYRNAILLAREQKKAEGFG